MMSLKRITEKSKISLDEASRCKSLVLEESLNGAKEITNNARFLVQANNNQIVISKLESGGSRSYKYTSIVQSLKVNIQMNYSIV